MITPSLIIVDDFYTNAMGVREYALSLPFNVTGNYPGARTSPLSEPHFSNAKKHFEELLNRKITYWPKEYNTSYQYTTKESKSWIHHDSTMWAAVLYLTPDAPLEAGTAIYRNKETKISRFDKNNPATEYNDKAEYTTDESKWEEVITIKNVFNRLVMYRGEYYHRSMLAGFGDNQFNGRLFQTIFFD